MDITIIIVNYNRFELTKKCIESILKNLDNLKYEVVVVDNNSTNESYQYLNKKFSQFEQIKIIDNEENSGYGAASNTAAKIAQGKYILILNPDVVVLNDAIQKMYNRIANDKNVAMIGCKLLNQDLTLQYSCRRFIGFTKFMFSRTPLKKLIPLKLSSRLEEEYLMKDFDHESERYVDWIMGSCMLCEKEEFLRVGGFSKEYFMYFEDVDLCYKINLSGKKVLYYPYASMIHLHNQQSTKKLNKFTFIHFISMIKFYKKYYLNNK